MTTLMNKLKTLSFFKLAILSMSVITAVASASFDTPRTELDAKGASDLGIKLTVDNFDYRLMDEPSPLFFTLDLSAFDACEIHSVGMDVWDSTGTLVFGTGISNSFGPTYSFRLDRKYLDTTHVGMMCQGGADLFPEGQDLFPRVYQFTLGDLVQFP